MYHQLIPFDTCLKRCNQGDYEIMENSESNQTPNTNVGATSQAMEQLEQNISQVSLHSANYQPDVREKTTSAALSSGSSAANPPSDCKDYVAGCSHQCSVKEALLDRVSKSDGHFKHQQRGDPDLAYEEKLSIATELLENKPAVFLTRFGKYLMEEDLSFFKPMQSDYIVEFHLKEAKRRLDDRKNQTKIRNRRYEAMKEMLSKGDYFSDDEMKHRDPLLYEQMVGRHLTDDDIAEKIDKTDLSFSNILMKHIEVQHNERLYQYQKDMEDSQMEESEDENEEEEEEEEEEEMEDTESDGRVQVSDTERMLLRNEFMRNMQLRFLNGDDPEFNYSEVDNNVEYDSVDIRTRDEEESYFDEEDAQTADSVDSKGGQQADPSEDSVHSCDMADDACDKRDDKT